MLRRTIDVMDMGYMNGRRKDVRDTESTSFQSSFLNPKLVEYN